MATQVPSAPRGCWCSDDARCCATVTAEREQDFEQVASEVHQGGRIADLLRRSLHLESDSCIHQLGDRGVAWRER